ncbi:hypothetical protein [Microbacterium hydrothermale]|uniref:hypothetical protein n=1 Tax=Microbacterium hydrothermale TaxID=857427 RepID=UPI0010A90283|nr:hypothetical protein [Microbacterium hydrothermale]
MSLSTPADQGQLEEMTAQLRPTVHQTQDKVDECRAKVDSVHEPSGWERLGQALLTTVFPVAGFYFAWKELESILMNKPEVRRILDEAASSLEAVLTELAKLLSPGNPFAMRSMADQWDAVNTALTGVVAAIGDDRFYATSSWTDDMGRLYANVPAGQRGALEGLVPHVDNMRTFLRDHATRIIDLWYQLAVNVAKFVIEALPKAAAFITGNPLKWVDLATPIAEAISTILQLILDTAQTIYDFTRESNTQIETFKSNASNVTGTDFGRWPVARLT